MKKKIIAIAIALVACVAAQAIKTSELRWHSLEKFPLHGTLVHRNDSCGYSTVDPADSVHYARIPHSYKAAMRPELYDLGTNTAGMYIRFASNASAIGAKWKATKKFNMNHMTAAGIRGLDLYTRLDDGTWTTVSSARPSFGSHNTTTMVMTDMDPVMREYMLYLPLYDGVDSLFIGTDSAAVVQMPAALSPRAQKPIVYYGTSIVQGGCATRPGMVHTSILGRMLDREFINLGFSGNAKLDMDIAGLIASADPSLIVLDPLPNLKREELLERMPAFLAVVRAAHPDTPILLVESPLFPLTRFNNETRQTIADKNAALRQIYHSFKDTGDSNLHYFEGARVLGDCHEGTVDNYHLTDMGFTVFANNLLPVLTQLLPAE